MRTDALRQRRGQATIETMLIAFMGVVFLAAAFQLYLVNRGINRTLGQVHTRLLLSAYQYNNDATGYDPETVKIIWGSNHGFDQLRPPRLGLFERDFEQDTVRIYSHWVDQHGDPDDDCEPTSPPCKRTKAGGGLEFGSPWKLMADGFGTFASGNYFDWLVYNAPNALADATTLRDELQDVQELLEKYEKVRECLDDAEACARRCSFPTFDCPWDD